MKDAVGKERIWSRKDSMGKVSDFRNVGIGTSRWKPVGVFLWTRMEILGGEDFFFLGGVRACWSQVCAQEGCPPHLAVESAETYAKR